MLPTNLLGALSGLASALTWGGGDFIGGLATRRLPQFQVVALGALSGLAVFVPIGILRGEGVPSIASIAWALAAGVSGAVGVAALYAGLARGPMSFISPTATVVGASLPVLLSALIDRLPTPTQAAGILLGLGGIWLVSRPSGTVGRVDRTAVLLALAAGAGFGGYFVLIAQIDPGPVFLTLAFGKLAALFLSSLILLTRAQPLPSLRSSPLALLAGVLDGAGNLFYLWAAQRSGIAVGAVLSSMAPAATVLLSVWLLREPLRRPQAAGVLACLAGVGLISL